MDEQKIALVSVTVKLYPEHFPAGLSPDEWDIYRTTDRSGLFYDMVVPKGAEVCDVCNGAGCDWCDKHGYVFIEALD